MTEEEDISVMSPSHRRVYRQSTLHISWFPKQHLQRREHATSFSKTGAKFSNVHISCTLEERRDGDCHHNAPMVGNNAHKESPSWKAANCQAWFSPMSPN